MAEDASTRYLLCYLLGSRHSLRAVPLLLELLNDPDASVRGESADALAKIRSERAGPRLRDRLSLEQDDGVRQMVAIALGACGYRPAIPDLISLLTTDSGMLHGCAAWSLGELVATESETALINALSSETDEYAIQQMDLALERIRDQSVDAPG